MVIRSYNRVLRLAAAGAVAASLLGGCFGHFHPRKPRSYDRSFTDEDRDPTYKADPERADEEVRDPQ